jgi:hypothetical protein
MILRKDTRGGFQNITRKRQRAAGCPPAAVYVNFNFETTTGWQPAVHLSGDLSGKLK